jgi:spermidine/putrescine transport system permease protein
MAMGIEGRIRRAAPFALTAPIILVLLVMVIAPMTLMLVYSFFTNVAAGRDAYELTSANWHDAVHDTYYLGGLWKTVRISVIAAIASAIIGYPAAYYVASTRSRYRWLMLFAFLAPFWISFIIRTFSWVSILGDNGVINALFASLGWHGAPLKLLYTEFAVLVGLVHYVLPYMLVNLYVVLDGIDENLVPTARSLGASGWQAFYEITLPLSAPGLFVGLFLAFVLAAGSYVTPAILGGSEDYMFGNLIFDAIMVELNWPLGSALSMFLLGLLSIVSLVFARYVGLGTLYRGLAK